MILLSVLLTFLVPPHQDSLWLVDGYADKMSAFPGDTVGLFLNAAQTAAAVKIRLFDLKGREVASFHFDVFPQERNASKPFQNGFGYRLTGKIKVPPLKSGVYLWENKIPFIVRMHHPAIAVLYPSNTINAYNNAGGKSLYGFNSSDEKAAEKVSFLRPAGLPRHAEAFLRWMEDQQLENVGYVVDQDLDDYRAIRDAVLLIIPGHSEYWTYQARKNFDRFVRDGKHAMVLSGNTMWWQVRYNTTRDQLICYKSAKEDPIKSHRLKTINWNDISLNYPITGAIGVEFPKAGYGLKNDNGWDGFKIVRKSPLLENTLLKPGDVVQCPSDELDGAPLSGFLNDVPLLNREALGFYKAEIVGFDKVSRGGTEGVATWIVFRATPYSGIVINTASTDWCSYRGIGANEHIRIITRNMITKLIANDPVFSPEDAPPAALN